MNMEDHHKKRGDNVAGITADTERNKVEGGSTPSSNSSTAILLLDFQNEFVKPGGKLHSSVAGVMESTGMLGKVPHVVRAAR